MIRLIIKYSLGLLICIININPISAQLKINDGLIAGYKSKEGAISIYKGIPFATPPVGDLRWKAPQPVKPWKGVKECIKFAASPIQSPPVRFSMWTEEYLIPPEPISEDCLYLNVWTPAKTPKEKFPVLVWIYGGGFQSGGAAVPIYDGESFARRGVVFVSINYRVGVFGFFSHPDLTKESGKNASGNYGLMDQIAALEWVKRNINSFGGDASNVTIAGQSAGSMSVNCLVASPVAKGLFNKAIAHSGAFMLSSPLRSNTSLKSAEVAGEKVMKSFNLSSLQELRRVSAEDLFKKAGAGAGGPIVDGFILPDPVSKIFEEKKENPVSLLTGWNQDEGFLFGPIKNAEAFKADVEKTFGTNASKILSYYPASDNEQAALSQLYLSRDQVFGVQNYVWANVQASHGSEVFVYRFTRKVPAVGEYVKYGAFHTGEVPYAYDNLKFVDRPWEEVDHLLAKNMVTYWTNFVKTGNPNGQSLPNWPAYSESSKKIMLLGLDQESRQMEDSNALDFLKLIMSK